MVHKELSDKLNSSFLSWKVKCWVDTNNQSNRMYDARILACLGKGWKWNIIQLYISIKYGKQNHILRGAQNSRVFPRKWHILPLQWWAKELAFLLEPAVAVSQLGMNLSTFLTRTLQLGELQTVPILTKTGNGKQASHVRSNLNSKTLETNN